MFPGAAKPQSVGSLATLFAPERVAERLGGAVVVQTVSPDVGGVEVGVPQTEVRDTGEDLIARARQYQPGATVLGVQRQELVDRGSGTETIVGVVRDP
jgi:acetyltransferase